MVTDTRLTEWPATKARERVKGEVPGVAGEEQRREEFRRALL